MNNNNIVVHRENKDLPLLHLPVFKVYSEQLLQPLLETIIALSGLKTKVLVGGFRVRLVLFSVKDL